MKYWLVKKDFAQEINPEHIPAFLHNKSIEECFSLHLAIQIEHGIDKVYHRVKEK